MDLENFPTRETAKDMLGMISPIYDRSYVAKWIFEVMSVSLGLAQDTLKGLEKEAFPDTATWTLPYWENAYGLPVNESLSDEERRLALTKKRNYRRPMNPYRIAQMVTEICGRPAFVVENVAPHTFEVCISPGSTEANIQDIVTAIREIKQSQKHVRVVFSTPIGIRIRAEPRAQPFAYRTTGEAKKSGRWPEPSMIGAITGIELPVEESGEGTAFPYVLSGTRPDRNNIGILHEPELDIDVDGEGAVFSYPVAGTEPDRNTPGKLQEPGLAASISGEGIPVAYKICGSKKL